MIRLGARSRGRPAFTYQPPTRTLLSYGPRPVQALPRQVAPPPPPAPPRPTRWPRRAPQAPPPPSLLGAAGPGVWRCRSRALPGSVATATAVAGSSSPSTGEGRGLRGTPGLASPGPPGRGPRRSPRPGAPGPCRATREARGRAAEPFAQRWRPRDQEVPGQEVWHRLGRRGARGGGLRGWGTCPRARRLPPVGGARGWGCRPAQRPRSWACVPSAARRFSLILRCSPERGRGAVLAA